MEGLIRKLSLRVISTEVLKEKRSPNYGISSRYAISFPVPNPP